MALVNLQVLSNEVRPEVPDCMDVVILGAIRRAVIDFCKRTDFWQADLPAVTTVSGTSNYAITPPVGQAVNRVLHVISDGLPVTPASESDLDARVPGWRLQTGAQALRWMMVTPREMRVHPIPSAAYDVVPHVSLRPAPDGNDVEDYVYEEYSTALAAGAKALLCAMPDKEWTNYKLVPYFQNIFEEAVKEAQLRSAVTFTPKSEQARSRYFGS